MKYKERNFKKLYFFLYTFMRLSKNISFQGIPRTVFPTNWFLAVYATKFYILLICIYLNLKINIFKFNNK